VLLPIVLPLLGVEGVLVVVPLRVLARFRGEIALAGLVSVDSKHHSSIAVVSTMSNNGKTKGRALPPVTVRRSIPAFDHEAVGFLALLPSEARLGGLYGLEKEIASSRIK